MIQVHIIIKSAIDHCICVRFYVHQFVKRATPRWNTNGVKCRMWMECRDQRNDRWDGTDGSWPGRKQIDATRMNVREHLDWWYHFELFVCVDLDLDEIIRKSAMISIAIIHKNPNNNTVPE